MTKTVLCFALSLLAALPLAAQDDANAQRDFEIGWNVLSYVRQGDVNLYGGDLSFTVHATPRIGIVADVSVSRSTDTSPTIDIYTYRFGPKFVVRRGGRITTFGEILAGGTRLKGSASAVVAGTTIAVSDSINGFSFAVGGGVDLGIRPWIAWRIAQFDYSLLKFSGIDGTSNGFRVGTGLVFRFGGS